MRNLAQFTTIQNILFFGLLALGTGAFIWLINDFLLPIFWAVVFAIVFHPVQVRWELFFRSKTVGALLTLVTVFILIFAPIWFVGGLVVDESLQAYARYSDGDTNGAQASLVSAAVTQLGRLERYGIEQSVVREKLTSLAQIVSEWLAGQAVVFGQATFGVMVKFLLMLYLLFFLLRDGPRIGKILMHVLPLGDEREKALFGNFSRITRSIFKGTLTIAVIQGSLGGILFAIAGVEAALLWAVVMTMLSIIPAIGPSIIWFPASIILILSGALWQGVMILIGGILLISLIDNILRPLLVGRDTKMPDAIVLLSTLGGLALFGITGFIIGPVIAGFFLSMWKIFEVDYHEALETQG